MKSKSQAKRIVAQIGGKTSDINVEETLDRNEVFTFLETLRESGVTNMFGAAPYISVYFGCTRNESRYWLSEWMRSYNNDE